MKHYRVIKMAKPAGPVVKTMDILAKDDSDAMRSAREDHDCPVCDVLQAGTKIGAIR